MLQYTGDRCVLHKALGDKCHMIPQGHVGNHSLEVPCGGQQSWIPTLP